MVASVSIGVKGFHCPAGQTDRQTENQSINQSDRQTAPLKCSKSPNMVPLDLGQKDRPRNGVSRRNSRTECTTCIIISLGVYIYEGVHRTSLGILDAAFINYDLAFCTVPFASPISCHDMNAATFIIINRLPSGWPLLVLFCTPPLLSESHAKSSCQSFIWLMR